MISYHIETNGNGVYGPGVPPYTPAACRLCSTDYDRADDLAQLLEYAYQAGKTDGRGSALAAIREALGIK